MLRIIEGKREGFIESANKMQQNDFDYNRMG